MIIFGTRHIRSTVNTGTFYCPSCKQRTPYKHIENREYGHLFFIPLLPLGSSGEYIECQHCGKPFYTDVLQHDPDRQQRQFLLDYQKLVLKSMQLVAAVDSCISDAEIQVICEMYRHICHQELAYEKVKTESERLRYLPNEVYAEVNRLAPSISDQGKEVLIRTLIHVAFGDGDPSSSEYQCISDLAQRLQITEAHFRGIVQTTLDAHYSRDLPAT
jgi:uncharacterized tellurite resistance protein B-like protein